MRQIKLFIFVTVCSLAGLLCAAPSQVEFVARIEAIQKAGAEAVLTMELTPAVSVPVRITSGIEIKDERERPANLDRLLPGMFVKIEAVFTDQGLLALEVEITGDSSEFELTGPIQSIQETSPGTRQIEVLDFPVSVSAATEIQDELGNKFFAADLRVGQIVKVEGNVAGSELAARQVKLRSPDPGFALISMEGQVAEISGNTILVVIDGGVSSLVEISAETEIVGLLAAGVRVKVTGRMTPSLTVAALKIRVEDSFRLMPDELRLGFSETGRVYVVLPIPNQKDLRFRLLARNPSLASPLSDILTIPAGSLTASFEVRSGSTEGRARIEVQAPADLGGVVRTLEVEVEDERNQVENEDEQELEIKWNPRKIESALVGPMEVQPQLNMPAPQNLSVRLFLKDGDPSLVSFPDSVMIPAGASSVRVTLQILATSGRAKIRAALPGGGDTDDLDLDFRSEDVQKLDVRWSPDDVRLSPGGSASIQLLLDRPAPSDLKISLSVKDGDPSLVESLPAEIQFAAGQGRQSITVKAQNALGKVKFRAALPFEFGGDEDELEIEIR